MTRKIKWVYATYYGKLSVLSGGFIILREAELKIDKLSRIFTVGGQEFSDPCEMYLL